MSINLEVSAAVEMARLEGEIRSVRLLCPWVTDADCKKALREVEKVATIAFVEALIIVGAKLK